MKPTPRRVTAPPIVALVGLVASSALAVAPRVAAAQEPPATWPGTGMPGLGAPQAPPLDYPAPASPPPYYAPALVPPATLPYEEGEPIPNGYVIKKRSVRSLLIGGSVTFGTTYLVSLIFGAALAAGGVSDGQRYLPLVAPIVGPFITIGTVGSGAGTPVLVLDGLLQLGGMTLLLCGAAMDEKFLQHTAPPADRALDVLLHPAPILTSRGGGLRWTF